MAVAWFDSGSAQLGTSRLPMEGHGEVWRVGRGVARRGTAPQR